MTQTESLVDSAGSARVRCSPPRAATSTTLGAFPDAGELQRARSSAMHSPLRTVCEAKQKRTGWRFFACLVLLISMGSASFAASPEDRISQYGHTVWRIQDGYFGGMVWNITQTTDGYIWVGTDAGLFKFDGVRFVRWASPSGEQLPPGRVLALLGARGRSRQQASRGGWSQSAEVS